MSHFSGTSGYAVLQAKYELPEMVAQITAVGFSILPYLNHHLISHIRYTDEDLH